VCIGGTQKLLRKSKFLKNSNSIMQQHCVEHLLLKLLKSGDFIFCQFKHVSAYIVKELITIRINSADIKWDQIYRQQAVHKLNLQNNF